MPSTITPSLLGVYLAAFAVSCSESTSSRGRAGIRLLDGGGVTDTIQASLPRPLTIELRDSTGQLASGRVVRFTSMPASDSSRRSESVASFGPLTGQTYSSLGIAITDSRGQASILVTLGTVAGPARVMIAVPDLGLVDTTVAGFTVLPGSPAAFVITPRDTTVQPNAAYLLSVSEMDRFKNAVAGTPSFTPSAGITAVSSSGQVTVGSNWTRASISIRSGATLVDTARVSVVQPLPLVATVDGSVVRVNLDGTGQTVVTRTGSRSVSPSMVSAKPTVAFYEGDPSSDARISIVSTNGEPILVVGPSTGFASAAWPRFSRDGAWIYFSGFRTNGSARAVWRVHPDGTGLDSLATFSTTAVNTAPSISADGHTVAVDNGQSVELIDVATRTSRFLNAPCGAPRFSPDGRRLSCVRNGSLSIVNANDASIFPLATPDVALDDLTGADWTPEGAWVLVARLNTQAALVNVETSAMIQLPILSFRYFQFSFVL